MSAVASVRCESRAAAQHRALSRHCSPHAPSAAAPVSTYAPRPHPRVGKACVRVHRCLKARLPRGRGAAMITRGQAAQGEGGEVENGQPVSVKADSRDKEQAVATDTIAALDAMLGVPSEEEDPDRDGGGMSGKGRSAYVTVPLVWRAAPRMVPGGEGKTNEYVAVTVGLPYRATPSQVQRGVKGVELDFIIDSGCSTNIILPEVQMGLDAPVVGQTPGGVSATGAIQGGVEVNLGNAELGGVTVMTGLRASAMAVPVAGAAGIVGNAFLSSFDAVEFRWGGRPGCAILHQQFDPLLEDAAVPYADWTEERAVAGAATAARAEAAAAARGMSSEPGGGSLVGRALTEEEGEEDREPAAGVEASGLPQVPAPGSPGAMFPAEDNALLVQIPLRRLANSLQSVQVEVNGVEMVALLDTGAPTTILNTAAAQAAGVAPAGGPLPPAGSPTAGDDGATQTSGGGRITWGEKNVFGKLARGVGKVVKGLARKGPAEQDGAVWVMGAGGVPMRLDNAAQPLDLTLPGAEENAGILLSGVLPLIGDLPAFKDGLDVGPETPAAILSLDALTSRSRVVLCCKRDCMYIGGDGPIDEEASLSAQTQV